jgi:hypothetical protein
MVYFRFVEDFSWHGERPMAVIFFFKIPERGLIVWMNGRKTVRSKSLDYWMIAAFLKLSGYQINGKACGKMYL